MKELEELLIRDWLVPADLKTRIVYHYTSAAGLIGILSSGVLRGTNASFLNDASEIEHGLTVCLDVLKEEQEGRSSVAERTLLERAIGLMRDDALPTEVYVTSFSGRRDLLSQWRGYGSADGRFCIGFQLSQFSERDFLQLPRPVDYSLESQREQVRRAIHLSCNGAVEAGDDARAAWNAVTSLTFHLRRIMCSFKHAGFAEEDEWRSVTTMLETENLQAVHFEAHRGVPRPFVTMLVGSRASAHLPVVEVCIGHTERKKATLRATQLLLSRYGYGSAKVTETDIPFTG